MRAIQIGLGGRGRHWLQVCGRCPEVEIVAGVDLSAECRAAAQEAAGLQEGQLFESMDQALSEVEADFVVDVTPPSIREKVATAALDRGLDVLAEKAMGEDWPMAQRIANLAARSGRVYMVTQNYRFRAFPRTARRLLDEGFLGDINTVVVGFYRDWGRGRHYVEIDYALLIEMAVHHFDTLRYVLDRDPEQMTVRTWNAPWGWHKGDVGHNALFEFSDGLKVIHHALGCSVGKMSCWDGEWRIEGERGTLEWDGTDLVYTLGCPPDRAKSEKIPLDELPVSDTDAVLAEFLSAVSEQREPECSARDNLGTLAMVFGSIESDRQGRTITLEEMHRG